MKIACKFLDVCGIFLRAIGVLRVFLSKKDMSEKNLRILEVQTKDLKIIVFQ